MGPFKVLARTVPIMYRLDIPATWRVFPEFNVERLRPYLRCPAGLGGDSDTGPPPPVLARGTVAYTSLQGRRLMIGAARHVG